MNVELMAKTQVFTTVESLQQHLSETRPNASVGFVPTMGALHGAHMTLVRAAMECDVVVVSIFVNPTQFNEASDLEKYPRTLESDLKQLEEVTDCVVFAPTVGEMYPEGHVPTRLDLGQIAVGMEGAARPGHFDGVVEVVYRLFEIVKPTKAYFGEKDYQQLAIVRLMVRELDLPLEIVGCPTYREPGGLAASSRNLRLSVEEREKALILYQSLAFAKEHQDEYSPEEMRNEIHERFETSDLNLAYINFVDVDTFEEVTSWSENTRGFIAAKCGEIHLLDNLAMA